MTGLEPATPSIKFTEKAHRKKQQVILWLSNNSFNANPSWTMELRVLLPALFCGAMYATARAFLLKEDLIAFRGQNPGVYRTVDWLAFLPHV